MKRPKQANDNRLLNSLKLMNIILKDDGHPYETHVLLNQNWAIAHNGVIGIGEPILEDLYACPNAKLMVAALSKCGQSISITQLEQKLSITSGKFRALIPCLPPENLPRIFPDPACAFIDDRFKAALSAVAPLSLDENNVVTASVLSQRGTLTATDRKVILQAYHGIDLPEMALPKSIIKPLTSNVKKLKSFGFSGTSCTFYFEDDSWLKTQLFAENWPNIDNILNRKANAWPLPENFFEGVRSLEPFSDNGDIFFNTNVLSSHEGNVDTGATFEIYGLPKGPIMSIKQLKMVEPYIKTIDFLADGPNGKVILFFGDNVRGCIAGKMNR